jgi:acetyl-CoA carboxylase biotin carboxylase subunit
MKFNKILIANRGEIAVRVIRAAKALNIKTVAIYSQADKDGLHIIEADEAWCIGEESLAETYLNVDKIMEIALKTGAEAIHPGYGFLAENPTLVAACEKNSIAFIGPSVRAISLMGNKIEARAFVDQLGVPMTKGVTGSPDELKKLAKAIELPILVKAAAGGGGKGMRIVRDWSELDAVIESTSREALAYFGDAEVFVEKYVENPRHIEIQILGDTHGNILHLYERECSIQRRYQKIIEESPSPTLTQEVREKMGKSAVDIAKAIGYYSAGTIEFLVDADLNYYFLEMNTRIQVEHPVTEMVTGVDLVKEQISIAAGNTLKLQQSDIQQNGHAIEARIYAEQPENDFLPAPGQIDYLKEAHGENVRVDTGLTGAVEIKSFFDPMISKLIVWADTRDQAIHDLKKALKEYVVLGISTNIPFMLQILQEQDYLENQISTKYCDTRTADILKNADKQKSDLNPWLVPAAYLALKIQPPQKNSVWSKLGYWRMLMEFELEIDGNLQKYELHRVSRNCFEIISGGNSQKGAWKTISKNLVELDIDNQIYQVYLAENAYGKFNASINGYYFSLIDSSHLPNMDFYESQHVGEAENFLKSPMPGKLIKVMAKAGEEVKKGQTLLIVEAMKMENNLLAPRDGQVEEVFANEGEMVDSSKVLLSLKEE